MRKLTLAATAIMFIGAQAALAAPLPTASGEQLRGTDSPIVSVKHKKKHKMKRGMSSSGMQGGTMQGGGMQGGGMSGTQGGGMSGTGGGMSGGAGGQGGMQGGTSR
jgi:hypothetical protein